MAFGEARAAPNVLEENSCAHLDIPPLLTSKTSSSCFVQYVRGVGWGDVTCFCFSTPPPLSLFFPGAKMVGGCC